MEKTLTHNIDEIIKTLSEKLKDVDENFSKKILPSLVVLHVLDKYKPLLESDYLKELDIWNFLSDILPNITQTKFPVYKTNSLIIKAWTASLNHTDKKIANLQWINSIFRHLIKSTGEELDTIEVAEDIKSDIKKIKNSLNNILKAENGQEVPLGDFFKNISVLNKHSRTILDCFFNLLEELPKIVINKKIKDIIDRKDDFLLQYSNLAKEYSQKVDATFEVFGRIIENQDKPVLFILGAKISSISGIRILSTRFNEKSHNRHDVFSVYSFDRLTTDTKLKFKHFTSIQGLFIPIDSRYELYTKWKEKIVEAESSSLISRNISHNLGSHAIMHIIKDLRNKNGDFKDISTFLEYLNNRSALIAEVSSGIKDSFKVNMSLQDIINEFNNQKLLLKNLCLTENYRLRTISLTNVKDKNNLDVDIPSGKIGIHALYAIIENFARNSAKHDNQDRENNSSIKLALFIENIENSNLVKISLWDKNSSDINNTVLKRLNKLVSYKSTKSHFLWQNNITDTSSYSLGHAEMKTWAAYLRGLSIFDEIKSENGLIPPLLNYTTKDNKLCLEFYLKKTVLLSFYDSDTISKISSEDALFKIIRLSDNSIPEKLPNGRIILQNKENNIQTPFGNILNSNSYDIQSIIPVQKLWLETLFNFVFKEIKTEFNSMPVLHILILDNTLIGRFNNGADNRTIELKLPFLNIKAHIVDEAKIDSFLKTFDVDSNVLFSIFDRHGNAGSISNNTSQNTKIIHYEKYTENNNYTNILNSINNEADNVNLQVLFGLLAECSVSKVLIVDDRGIIDDGETEKHKEINKAGVYLLNPKSDWEKSLEDIHKNIKPVFPIHNKIPFVFESIHASLNKSRYTTIENWNEFIENRRKIIPYFSLHSGRGGVTEQYKNIAFFPVYIIKDYGLDKLSKFFFVTNLLRQGISSKISLL